MFDAYYMQRKSRPASPPRKQRARPGSVEWVAATLHLDWYDREQLERAAAIEAAAERRDLITGSMFATGRTKAVAEHLADHTDMSTQDAVACLSIASQSTGRQVPPLAERCSAAIGTIGVVTQAEAAGMNNRMSWSNLAADVYGSRRKGQTK
ncbi:hypothetical protein ACVIHI_005779 [Bradyrhizobium sp. USDA 4524]|uniref:hypothetical protein n=1 Tax=unclassified Bradyrhizobium TaxID=2631580 RepID=UPI00209FE358|nr:MULTISPECIES: hypothetical protein [unclassified Bradyrhizobium]MCP1841300.1 hypothetical protein [Bradyrhizobium sp. USDA 4538]MCP1901863.1 hypothetical protein [Bradyrhizobium sp. USDA 4537]MCP1992480.1 hypothetical protein [Bradyrhizobium sp. USDA 4539]